MSEHSPLRFTAEDDAEIVKEYLRLKKHCPGNTLWKQMEVQQVVPGRSWQALKDRFENHIDLAEYVAAKPFSPPSNLESREDMTALREAVMALSKTASLLVDSMSPTGTPVRSPATLRQTSTLSGSGGGRRPSHAQHVFGTAVKVTPASRVQDDQEEDGEDALKHFGSKNTLSEDHSLVANMSASRLRKRYLLEDSVHGKGLLSPTRKNSPPNSPLSKQLVKRQSDSGTQEIPAKKPKISAVDRAVKYMMEKTGRTEKSCLKALWRCDGRLKHAIDLLSSSDDLERPTKPSWTPEDDQMLLSPRPSDVKFVQNKFGAHAMVERAMFLSSQS